MSTMKIGDLPAGASVYIPEIEPDVSSRRIVCELCGKEIRAGTEPALRGAHEDCSEKR